MINLFLNEFDFDVICKYFYDDTNCKYGDFQSLRPVKAPKTRSSSYTFTSNNGFVNIYINDGFLISRLFDFIQKMSHSKSEEIIYFTHEPSCILLSKKLYSNDYLKYIFSMYARDLWCINSMQDLPCLFPKDIQELNYRSIAIMALYLIEKGSPESEPNKINNDNFDKLYNIFSNKLFWALREKPLMNAPLILKLLTLCAINIQAYQEA